jgi:hypothetical protein
MKVRSVMMIITKMSLSLSQFGLFDDFKAQRSLGLLFG